MRTGSVTGLGKNYTLLATFLSIARHPRIRIFGEPAEHPKHQSDSRQREFPPVFTAKNHCQQESGNCTGRECASYEGPHRGNASYYFALLCDLMFARY
jgi:hypothetical protein